MIEQPESVDGDRCPGALRLHQADDGHVARIRVPGGRLTARQLVALCDLADDLGDGCLHLTSRGNVQVRGLAGDVGPALATRLSAAGLLPSLAHDRVRNVVASPAPDLDGVLAEFDAALCADPRLTALSGRFLFGLDDGSGEILALAPDLATQRRSVTNGPTRFQLWVAGVPTGLYDDPVPPLLRAAAAFLDVRPDGAWRVTDLPAPELAALRGDTAATGPTSTGHKPHLGGPQTPSRRATNPTSAEGWMPLGSAVTSQWRVVASLVREQLAQAQLVLTPWRSVVLRGVTPAEAHTALPDWGFAADSPQALTSACIGAPGCAKSLADVRADAAGLASANPGRRLHVSGCARRCGHPIGDHLEAVATSDGYQVGEH
ncbi:precorrin-3B synthase [Nocardioides limicola]|uniref:precorrin-3B synthase n=1 Tax=Nocardioides limicola TaxID=2803368 RepID=UPI00193BA480|nr:precorrin-3B synthase [Nocardioides sp. DJM-14]